MVGIVVGWLFDGMFLHEKKQTGSEEGKQLQSAVDELDGVAGGTGEAHSRRFGGKFISFETISQIDFEETSASLQSYFSVVVCRSVQYLLVVHASHPSFVH